MPALYARAQADVEAASWEPHRPRAGFVSMATPALPRALFAYRGPANEKPVCRMFAGEGSVVCVLVSDIAPEQVVQLAFAKAMP